MSSTSSVGSVGVVDEGAAAGDPTAKPTTQGKAADAGNEVKGHPNEEQIRAVFSNGVVSLQLQVAVLLIFKYSYLKISVKLNVFFCRLDCPKHNLISKLCGHESCTSSVPELP